MYLPVFFLVAFWTALLMNPPSFPNPVCRIPGDPGGLASGRRLGGGEAHRPTTPPAWRIVVPMLTKSYNKTYRIVIWKKNQRMISWGTYYALLLLDVPPATVVIIQKGSYESKHRDWYCLITFNQYCWMCRIVLRVGTDAYTSQFV